MNTANQKDQPNFKNGAKDICKEETLGLIKIFFDEGVKPLFRDWLVSGGLTRTIQNAKTTVIRLRHKNPNRISASSCEVVDGKEYETPGV